MADVARIELPSKRGKADLERGSIYFIGTATVIIEYAGFTILTDPNFLHKGEKVRLGYGLRSRRLTNPALEIEALPPLDLVLLSHMHEDHFDRVAAEKLDRTLPIVTTPHAAKSLKKMGFTATCALETWETMSFRKGASVLRIASMPGQHGGPLFAKLLPPVMGSFLEFETAAGKSLLSMHITGDTLIHRQLKEIPLRYPEIDLALLHLGGTRALGVLVTMDAKQGVEAIKLLSPTIAIPIHYNDYTVFRSPLSDFQKRVKLEGLEDVVRYLSHGESYMFRVPRSRQR